jgi:hypothetical protein
LELEKLLPVFRNELSDDKLDRIVKPEAYRHVVHTQLLRNQHFQTYFNVHHENFPSKLNSLEDDFNVPQMLSSSQLEAQIDLIYGFFNLDSFVFVFHESFPGLISKHLGPFHFDILENIEAFIVLENLL